MSPVRVALFLLGSLDAFERFQRSLLAEIFWDRRPQPAVDSSDSRVQGESLRQIHSDAAEAGVWEVVVRTLRTCVEGDAFKTGCRQVARQVSLWLSRFGFVLSLFFFRCVESRVGVQRVIAGSAADCLSASLGW